MHAWSCVPTAAVMRMIPTLNGLAMHNIYGTPSQMDIYKAIIFCVHAVLKK